MCKKIKLSKCEAAAFCAWLKTPEGKCETLKLITENGKFQQILSSLVGSCCKINCVTSKQLIKAARKALYDIWKLLPIATQAASQKKSKE